MEGMGFQPQTHKTLNSCASAGEHCAIAVNLGAMTNAFAKIVRCNWLLNMSLQCYAFPKWMDDLLSSNRACDSLFSYIT